MMGPSAPNGPPVPMAMAAESGFRIATFGCDAAAIDQHRFHRFGNAVAANLVGAVARHDANDDSADHGRDDHPQAKMIVARAAKGEREAMVKENIGEQPDQVVEQVGDDARQTCRCPPASSDISPVRNSGFLAHRCSGWSGLSGFRPSTPRVSVACSRHHCVAPVF